MILKGDFVGPQLTVGLGEDAIIGPISPFLHLPPSPVVNLRLSTSSAGDEADVGSDEPPLTSVVPEPKPPGELVRWVLTLF